MQYSREQGLLGRNMTLDELFVSTGRIHSYGNRNHSWCRSWHRSCPSTRKIKFVIDLANRLA